MGFQHMKKPIHDAASRKGGSWKLKKGLGAMDPEKAKAIQSMGGKVNAENKRKGIVRKEENTGGNDNLLERVLNSLDD